MNDLDAIVGRFIHASDNARNIFVDEVYAKIEEHNRHLGELRAKDAEIERLRELKTPASRQLLNITKGLLDAANTECDELLAALKAITELGDVRADEASQIADAAIAKVEGK